MIENSLWRVGSSWVRSILGKPEVALEQKSFVVEPEPIKVEPIEPVKKPSGTDAILSEKPFRYFIACSIKKRIDTTQLPETAIKQFVANFNNEIDKISMKQAVACFVEFFEKTPEDYKLSR